MGGARTARCDRGAGMHTGPASILPPAGAPAAL
jgi:hypothetical protein